MIANVKVAIYQYMLVSLSDRLQYVFLLSHNCKPVREEWTLLNKICIFF